MEAHRLAVLCMHVTLLNLYEDLNTVLQCPIQIVECESLAIMGTWDAKPGRVKGLVSSCLRYKSDQHGLYSVKKEGLVPVWNGCLDCSFVSSYWWPTIITNEGKYIETKRIRMNECLVFTQNARKHCNGILGMCVKPCYRYKKHTKHPSFPINFVLPHGLLESQLDYPHGLHIPKPLLLPLHISQASGMAYI